MIAIYIRRDHAIQFSLQENETWFSPVYFWAKMMFPLKGNDICTAPKAGCSSSNQDS